MRASKRSRNTVSETERVSIPDDVKVDIAGIVGRFHFDMPGKGSCFWRARAGLAVLNECGIEARMKAGAMLFRVGPHRKRDTLRYALPNNLGGYYDGWLVGHAWNQVGEEIVDFSAGDWAKYVEPVGPDGGLGPIQWELDPPDFIWQPAKSLPRWRSSGVPSLGDVWYGPWGDPMPPPTTTLTEDDRRVLERHRESVQEMVADFEIRKRLESG